MLSRFKKSAASAFLVLLTALNFASSAAQAADLKLAGKTVQADQDKDGKPDHWITYDSQGVRALIASDTNGDGKPDSWKHPLRGMTILRERDRNFDGRVDERQVTDFIYDKTLKFNRHLYIWKESDGNHDGVIDLYKVRGEKSPKPDRVGQKMDPSPWSEAKEAAAEAQRKLTDAENSAEVEQVRQMNARQGLNRS